MYKVTVEQSEGNKITPTKGDTLASIAVSDKCEAGTTWQRIALYNWGTVDPHEVNRALIELVGCSTVDAANPEKSVLDPELGTTKAIYIPKAWTLPTGLAVEKTHTVKLRKRYPAPAAVLTKVDPWFIPETETCDVGFRIEGLLERADKLDFDVYASNYCKATPTADDGFFKYAFDPLDIPIRQKRAFTEATLRKAATITDWKGESEAKDGMLKPRAEDKKRYIDVACSPYTVLIRYYKADGDKDAKVTLKPFWPRFKKVFKDAADTTGIDGAATGLKEKTEAAVKAARDLAAAMRKAEADIEAFVKASERAALRAHSATKAANKAVTDMATAKAAVETAKTDVGLAKTAKGNPPGVPTAPDYNAKKGTAGTSTKDGLTKATTGQGSVAAAAAALAVAKAAAADAKAKGSKAKTSATDVATKAETAKTKADEAKAAATEPKAVKDPAEAAAKRAETAKAKADELKVAATTASGTADTCSADADTAAGTADGAKTDANAMQAGAKEAATATAKQLWTPAAAQADTAVTKAGTAHTKAGTTKTQAGTLQTSAAKARIDAAKLQKALAPAKAEASALETATSATDDNVVYDKSLEISWKVEKTAKLKHGQLLILDKEGTPVFRKPLKDSDLTKDSEITCKPGEDDHAKYWLDKKTKLDLSLSNMPYRAQIQAHSAWDEAEGVAVVAMHTEVRLWTHKDNGTHAVPTDDSQSLHLWMAPWRPDKDPPAAGSNEWYKLKLAEAGFHPGPVNTAGSSGDTDPFQIALAEMQRTLPKEEKKPFTRLTCDGAPNGPTKDVLARTDVADKALKECVDIKDKTKATLDAADAAKVAALKGATDALAAQTDAVEAARLADEAATAANLAATDADAAKVAVDQAKTDVEAADDARSSGAEDAATKASTAQASAGTAATKAASAALSATQAAAKATAAKTATETAATKAGTAKTSTADTATKVATAKTKADEAKEEGKNADPSVKDPAADCATKAATAETSSNTAKASGVTASTSAEASKADAPKAETAANQGKTDADTLKSAADQVLSSAQSGNFAQARGQAGTAATNAVTAKASTAQAKTDVQALKAKADQAKTDADKVKTDADQAKTDVTALALAAKTADDAAEADRVIKKQRKDEVDKVLRPVREMFGNPSSHADYTRAQAEPLLGDKSKDLILWVDDRHYYDTPTDINELKMGDYRGGMTIGDTKVAKEKTSIARPFVPLEARLPLLAKAQSLDVSGAPPAVTEAMQRAIGPLRVDWTFEELPIEVDNIPEPTLGAPKTIAALDRAGFVKAKTAAALVAAGQAKAAATAPVTRTTAAQTELGKLVTASADSVPLAGQAATDVAAAQTAADTAKADVDAAASAAANAADDAGTKAEKARTSCAAAATKAATAVQSATAAAAKVAEAKTAATATATEAGHAKTDAATLADKVDAVKGKIEEADLEAGVAASAGAVTSAIDKATTAAEKAKKSADATKTDSAAADTECGKCKTAATTADTAAQLAKSTAEAIKAAADTAKGHADSGTWDPAKVAAATAVARAGEAKTAADQAKTDVGNLKSATDKAKPEVDKAKADADTAKTDAEAIEPETQTADTEAEVDRLSREAAGNDAASKVDPSVVAALGTRSRAWVAHMLGKDGKGKEVDGKLYTNCPATTGGVDHGGIRPDPLDDYYKAAFGLAKTGSNRPWLAIDDATNKVVCSVTHDDLGQDEAHVFAPSLGKAGIFLNPSRIAGDGYRYRAQVSFKELPAGASHPNREALLQRYVRPPAAHTAGLRLWRKTSFRGYARWTPAAEAGWQGYLDQVRDIYHAAHVHFIHEGPDPTVPMEYPIVGVVGPDELITAAEYQDCVNGKTTGHYAGLAAKYTAGQIWPYLDQEHWGVPEQAGSIDDMVKYLYNGLQNGTWRAFRAKLLHLVLKKIEANIGRLRGHVLVEFQSSPSLILLEYKCSQGGCASKYTQVANDPAGGEVHGGESYARHLAGVGCEDNTCAGSYVVAASRVLKGFPLAAVGCAFGATWLFTPRDADVWAHELGHHRHLEHAQANAGEDKIAPGGKVAQHDSQDSDFHASAPYAWQKFWDRWCIMSYDDRGKQHFCGKCLLKTAGWPVEALTNPGKDLQDA